MPIITCLFRHKLFNLKNLYIMKQRNIMALISAFMFLSSCSVYRLSNGAAVFARNEQEAREIYAGQNIVNRKFQGGRAAYSTRTSYVYFINWGTMSVQTDGDYIIVNHGGRSERFSKWIKGKRRYQSGSRVVYINTSPNFAEAKVYEISPKTGGEIFKNSITIDKKTRTF